MREGRKVLHVLREKSTCRFMYEMPAQRLQRYQRTVAGVLIALVLALLAIYSPVAPQLPTAGPTTISDPLSFLVQAGSDGKLMRTTDLVSWRRHDWPLPHGYEISDSLLRPDGRVVQTFDITPYGQFTPAHGDGGQVVEIGSDGFVRFLITQDGGKPGLQYFVGQKCGGTGWIVFGNDAPTGTWRGIVATLSGQAVDMCPGQLNQARTQYRLEQVTFPFAVDGVQIEPRTLPTIISEHYTGGSVATAANVER